jgi:hypothetical protein
MRCTAHAAFFAAMTSLVCPSTSLAHGDWPDGPHKSWFESLQRPDNHLNPYRALDPKSLYCCGAADVVKNQVQGRSGRRSTSGRCLVRVVE